MLSCLPETNLFKNPKGVTLVELMVTLVVASIVIISIFSAYEAQQRSHTAQQQVTEMQQNQRVALDNLARNLRMAGLNPDDNLLSGFQLVDIQHLDFAAPYTAPVSLTAGGHGSIQFTADIDEDGTLDGNESFTYSLYDSAGGIPPTQDGILDLGLDTGGGRELIAESIEFMEFAFAYDDDADGDIDTAGGNIIWATDPGNTGSLTHKLDDDNDGDIDINDTPGGVALGGPVNISEIRAVRIWLLTRAKRPDQSYYNSNTYVVGGRNPRVTPNDNVRRRLVEFTLYLRNI